MTIELGEAVAREQQDRASALEMEMRLALLCILLAAGGGVTAAVAQDRAGSPVVDQIVKCRTLTVDAERLACFDKAVGVFADAVDRKQVAVVNREEVRQAKRSLFGITLPNIQLFGGKDDDDEPVQQISSTIRSAGNDGQNHYVFTLAEGGTWRTLEGTRFPPEPKDNVVIRRAALGSYFANIDGKRAVRVERLR